MAGKYLIKKASNGQFYFNLLAGNSEKILTSELYVAKASAINGIESVKKNAGLDSNYEIRKDNKQQEYFVLKAKNHEIIGKSESYSSRSALNNGIASVKSNADSVIDDQAG